MRAHCVSPFFSGGVCPRCKECVPDGAVFPPAFTTAARACSPFPSSRAGTVQWPVYKNEVRSDAQCKIQLARLITFLHPRDVEDQSDVKWPTWRNPLAKLSRKPSWGLK